MNRDAFIAEVRKRAELADDNQAEQATRATLEILGRRLFGGEATDLASQLPSGIREFLLPPEANKKFDRDEFVRLVAEREGVPARTAEQHIKIVLSVVSENVSTGEMSHVWAQLPEEYASLF